MPCTYQENTGKKNQGWAFLDRVSAPPVPNADDLTTMDIMAPIAIEDDGTYETLSK
jgi:hypothetical protein